MRRWTERLGEAAPGGGDAADANERHDGLPRIGFIGAGRVGGTLAVAFSKAGWPITAVASRDPERRAAFQAAIPSARAFTEPAAVLDEADLCFLTVPDDAVGDVAARLHLYSGQGLVHTSGLLSASVLRPAMAAGTSVGSFHPLVGFADRERALEDLVGATVAVEGDEALLRLLGELAESIDARPVRVPGDGKAAYHAAAVLAAGGFVGLLDAIAELGRGAGLDEKGALAIYAPLIRATLRNAEDLGIREALTGPVVRGDAGTLRAHLVAMSERAPGARALYRAAALREIALVEERGELETERARMLREVLAEGS